MDKVTNKREINEINQHLFLYPSESNFEALASMLQLNERNTKFI
jgi:hypothetical protein